MPPEGATGGEAEVSPSPTFRRCRLDYGGEMTGEVEMRRAARLKKLTAVPTMALQNVMPTQS